MADNIDETYADSGLGRWFKEKWVDISRKKDGKHPPCGRSEASDSSYPKCRPSKKVSNKTPKTTKSMTTKDKKRAVRIKRRAESPVSTTGSGRSPVMTKLKEQTERDLEGLIQMPYSEFVVKYNEFSNDEKLKALMKYGREDGLLKDEVVKFKIRSIAVKYLIPTQNEIDIKQSLKYSLGFPEKTEDCLVGKDIKVAGKMIVSAEGKYIIDGHHRWSSVYCLNPDATVVCLDMSHPNFSPMDYLKVTQMAIAADKGRLPVNVVEGTNLLTVEEEELKDFARVNLSVDSLQLMTRMRQQIDTEQDAVNFVWQNTVQMQQSNQPVEGAPKRSFMPQTDTSDKWDTYLKSGMVNFKRPFTKGDSGMLKEYYNPESVTHMYVFDFDDTIAETHSMIYIKDVNTGEETSITPAEFARHTKEPHQQYDFREFEDVMHPKELEHTISAFSEILTRMENVAGKESTFLCILTARGPGKSGKTGSNIRSYLLDLFTRLLKQAGQEEKIESWTSILKQFDVITLGANKAADKSRWILDTANRFPSLKTVVFYDDAPKNREAFDEMKDELENRGVRAAVYDPTVYKYDPEHLAEAEVELQEGIMPVCAACLQEYIQKHKNVLTEAKYQGREVPLGKPMKGDVKKSKVYVRNPATGKIVKVNFGDKNMKIKKNIPARRKSFRARHNCANPGPRTKAKYWSCRAWEGKEKQGNVLESLIRMRQLAGLEDDYN